MGVDKPNRDRGLCLHTYADVNPEAVVRTAAISTTENSIKNKDGRCLRTG